jgi:hypothetical protein
MDGELFSPIPGEVGAKRDSRLLRKKNTLGMKQLPNCFSLGIVQHRISLFASTISYATVAEYCYVLVFIFFYYSFFFLAQSFPSIFSCNFIIFSNDCDTDSFFRVSVKLISDIYMYSHCICIANFLQYYQPIGYVIQIARSFGISVGKNIFHNYDFGTDFFYSGCTSI